jgi:uncharacterized protein YdeI (YjbR/CyaY-like superfamily)
MPSPPSRDDVRLFASAADFRAWLKANHDAAPELWVGFIKKGIAKTAMSYPESVDEALCFGWIDGLTRRVDDEVYTIRFTPRRPTSSWSAINIAKVAALTAAGRMHPAGTRAFEERDRRKDAGYAYERPMQELPSDMRQRLEADVAARTYWDSRTPSFRRQATYWILSAKRPETRERRFGRLLADAAEGRDPQPFNVARDHDEAAPRADAPRADP